MTSIFSTDNIVSFFVLVILEIVLGIDNVIFVSIIMNRLPKEKQPKARLLWMVFGIIMRSLLLMGLSWLLKQKGIALFTIAGKGFDLASLVMLAGGLFLIYKTVKEIHHKLEGDEEAEAAGNKPQLGFAAAIVQIVVIDMVFSFDSIITAGGTAKVVQVMIAAVVVAMIIMFLFSPAIAGFIFKHPTLKMLALSFLVMIGFVLLVEGWNSEATHELHLKNYVYFAMAFSFLVELLNMKMRKGQKSKPVELKSPRLDEKP
ncbi:putative tellurium resistance membrane protein TerC [Filimonas zeae]|uniref:Membrane protein n=1 Tax=Filimonas zeae TaxID=1737353 RepID=A0A917J4Z2_9BACT|nr:TerC family protein [Filimonas zeae]MDR6342243.1 putative tellurium resistance membrane protein TerC [Filimonas zeae]GGH80562.1 membrane protein [Filimonas zeae]